MATLKRLRPLAQRVYTFVLAEAELETVPEALWTHPKVRDRARKRGREVKGLVLDQALDHEAMATLADGDRRGRPDIAHMFLLMIQDSPLTKLGLTRVLIHTRHDQLIRVRPDWRVMRSQDLFLRVMEDLFRQGFVPRHPRLLTIEDGWPLERVIREEAQGTKVLLDETGTFGRLRTFESLEDPATIVLGGFPKGRFRQAKPEWFDRLVSVGPEQITVWSTLVPILAGLEERALVDEHGEPRVVTPG